MDIIQILLGALLAIVIILLIVLLKPTHRRELNDAFTKSEVQNQAAIEQISHQLNTEFLSFQNLLMQSLRSDLNILNENTTQRLFAMEKNMNEGLHQQVESTHSAFLNISKQMIKIDETQKNLQELSYHINDLQAVLNDKKTRGIFGEIELYALMENVMGLHQERYAKQYKLSNGSIVDAILFAKEPMGCIAIDSKFPLENYNRIMDNNASKADVQRYTSLFTQDVKKHIKTIADKYIIANETAEFAFMFIPAEAIFSFIHASLADVVKYSFEQKVYLVSPTTLMAYITAIKAIYMGQQRSEHMVEIQEELKKLAVEFERFEKRIQVVSNDNEKLYQDMKMISITANKIITRFQAIQDVDLDEVD